MAETQQQRERRFAIEACARAEGWIMCTANADTMGDAVSIRQSLREAARLLREDATRPPEIEAGK